MLLLALIIAVLLLEPSYYLLQSKGWPAQRTLLVVITVTGIALLLAGFCAVYYPEVHSWFIAIAFAVPICTWLVARTTRPRPGSPGASYLQVKTDCPHCGQSVTFQRRKQGNAALCPSCSEMLDVPHEAGNDRPHRKTQPPGRSGGAWVTLYRNLNPTVVELHRMRLEAEGIETFEADSDTAAADPVLAFAGGGVRLMVREPDVERARTLLDDDEDLYELPDDFQSEPLEEPVTENNQVLLLLEVLVITLLVPTLLAPLWGQFFPSLGIGGLPAGASPDAYRWDILFRVCLAIAGVRVAYQLLRPRRAQSQS